MSSIFKSERVILREMEEKDWIDVHKYASQEKVCQYQPWGPNSEWDSKEFVRRVLLDAQKENRSRFVFAVVSMENGEMVGAGEINVRNNANRAGEIAYIMNPDYWGMGFATEVANLLIFFGFSQLNFHRIFATCDSRNSGSIRVLEKVGMTKEGRMREDLWIKDGWRDSLLYSKLEHDWIEK